MGASSHQAPGWEVYLLCPIEQQETAPKLVAEQQVISRVVNLVADFSSSGSCSGVWGSDCFVPLGFSGLWPPLRVSPVCTSVGNLRRETGDLLAAPLLPPHSSQWHIHLEETAPHPSASACCP